MSGGLDIALARRDGRVVARIAPPRPALDPARLVGRPVEEAATLVPLVYAVCAATQEAATRCACGLPAPAGLGARVVRDALRDHLIHLHVALPEALGCPGDPLAVREGLTAHLAGDARGALADAAFAPGEEPASLADLRAWALARFGAPAAALRRLLHGWDPAWGRVALPLVPARLDLARLDPARLDLDRATLDGRAAEPGAAASHAAHPLLVDIAERLGPGPVWRTAARLIAAGRLAAEPDPERAGAARRMGEGAAAALSARGALWVRAARDGDRLAAFARLAPTDLVLHPNGLLARALVTLPAEPDAPLAEIARALVAVADPCVASAVRVVDRPAITRPRRAEEALHA